MKRFSYLLFFVSFLFFSSQLSAQFKWSYTNGSPGLPWTYFSAHDDAHLYLSNGSSIFRTDDGDCWDELPSTVRPYHGSDGVLIGFNLTIDDFRYLAGISAFLSYDAGDTWQLINLPEVADNFHYLGEAYATADALYIINRQAHVVHVSTDAGISWHEVPLPEQPELTWLEIEFEDGHLYAHRWGLLWRMNDDLSSMEPVDIPSGISSIDNILITGEQWWISESSDLWYSADGGQNWNTYTELPDSEGVRKMLINGNRLYALGSGGSDLRFSEDNGANWETTDSIQYEMNITTLSIAAVGGNVLCITYDDGILMFNPVDNTFGYAICGLGLNTGKLAYAGGQLWTLNNAGMFSYDVESAIWDTVPHLPEDFVELSDFVVSEDGKIAVRYKYGGGFYYSEDGGLSWTRPEMPATEWLQSYRVKDFTFANGDLFIVTELDFSSTVFRYEGNDEWTNFEDLIRLSVNFVVGDDGMIYTIRNGFLSRSMDAADTWENLGEVPTDGLLIKTEDAFFIIGGSLTRLYISFDGFNWQPAGAGLTLPSPSSPEYINDIFQVDDVFVLDLDNTIYGSKDSCQTWLPIERRFQDDLILVDSLFFKSTTNEEMGVFKSPKPSIFGHYFSGKVFVDIDNDEQFSTGDTPVPDAQVGPKQGLNHYRFFARTNDIGDYRVGLKEEQGDTIIAELPFINSDYYTISPAYYLQSSSPESVEEADFRITFTEEVTDLEIRAAHFPNARPGFETNIQITHRNIGTTQPTAVIVCQLDERLTYLDATPVPSEIIGDSLIWNIPENPLFDQQSITVSLLVPEDIALGDTLHSVVTTTPNMDDVDLANNTAIVEEEVVGSYDPNDKQVFPKEGLTAEQIVAGEELEYMIRFQNTGTFYAERVRITDQLDTALNWSTLKLEAASHEVSEWQLHPGGLLDVLFDQIFLPDSNANEAGSHGFVSFSIERNQEFDVNDRVTNEAAIYFDFNEPIITNEVIITVPEMVTSTASTPPEEELPLRLLQINPNPTGGEIRFAPNAKIGEVRRVRVFDTMGHLILAKSIGQQQPFYTLDLSSLPSGTYLVTVIAAQGIQSGQVVLSSSR